MIGFRTLLAAAGRGLAPAMGVTWNPDDKHVEIALDNGNLKAYTTYTGNNSRTIRATLGRSSGKYYFEISATIPSAGGFALSVGVATSEASLSSLLGGTQYGWAYIRSGASMHNNSTYPYDSAFNNGDVLGVAVDLDSGKIWFSLNGTWLASGNPSTGAVAAFTNLSGTVFPAATIYGDDVQALAYFSADDFVYAPPSGFSPWEA